MTPGPSGFARSAFAQELPCETEIPNLMLTPLPQVMKKPAAARGKRKVKDEEFEAEEAEAEEPQPEEPEASEAEEDEEDEPTPPAKPALAKPDGGAGLSARKGVTAAVQPQSYLKMFYKSSGAFGFRQRVGGQVFQLVCRKM